MQHETDGTVLKQRFEELEQSVREGDTKVNNGSKSLNKKWSKKRGKLVEQYRSLTDELALLRGRVERSVPKSASPDRRRIAHRQPLHKSLPEATLMTRSSLMEDAQDTRSNVGYKFTQGSLTDGVLNSRERGPADGRMMLFDSLKTAAEPGNRPSYANVVAKQQQQAGAVVGGVDKSGSGSEWTVGPEGPWGTQGIPKIDRSDDPRRLP